MNYSRSCKTNHTNKPLQVFVNHKHVSGYVDIYANCVYISMSTLQCMLWNSKFTFSVVLFYDVELKNVVVVHGRTVLNENYIFFKIQLSPSFPCSIPFRNVAVYFTNIHEIENTEREPKNTQTQNKYFVFSNVKFEATILSAKPKRRKDHLKICRIFALCSFYIIGEEIWESCQNMKRCYTSFQPPVLYLNMYLCILSI